MGRGPPFCLFPPVSSAGEDCVLCIIPVFFFCCLSPLSRDLGARVWVSLLRLRLFPRHGRFPPFLAPSLRRRCGRSFARLTSRQDAEIFRFISTGPPCSVYPILKYAERDSGSPANRFFSPPVSGQIWQRLVAGFFQSVGLGVIALFFMMEIRA